MPEVEKLVFSEREIMVHLDDGTPPWPLRLNEAVHRWMSQRRNMEADMAKLRAGHSDDSQKWIDRLTDEQARHVETSQRVADETTRGDDARSGNHALNRQIQSLSSQINALRSELSDERAKVKDLARLVRVRDGQILVQNDAHAAHCMVLNAANHNLAHENAVAAYRKMLAWVTDRSQSARSRLDHDALIVLAPIAQMLDGEIERMTDALAKKTHGSAGDEAGEHAVVPVLRRDATVGGEDSTSSG